MMLPVLLLVALLALLAALLWLRRQRAAVPPLRNGPIPPPRRAPIPPPRRRKNVPAWIMSRGSRGMALLALIGLTGLWWLLSTFGLLSFGPRVPAGEFVVRIAPFTSSAEDQRQGTIFAEQLIAALKPRLTTPLNIGLLNAPVTSSTQAAQLARDNNIDVLIWGEVLPGTTAEQAALRPFLLWSPNSPFEPRTWQGYDGHFVLPADYDLALQPLNGPAVLAPLLDSLNYFSRGDADKAAELCTMLRRDYGDVLRAELPAMLQALVLWGEGLYPDAEREAQAALEAADRPQHRNNLGAIQLDQQKLDPARNQLEQALAGAPNLPQAHANMGRLLLNEGRPADAIPALQRAVELQPDAPPLVAALGEAYRRNGQLAQARVATERVLQLDADNGPALAERGMLALTPTITVTQQLEWELEQLPQRSAENLADIRTQTETGIASIEALRNEYLRQANAYGVSGRPGMQRLAETQAAILEQELLNRRYQLMLVQIEQGRVATLQRRSGIRRFWDAIRGARTPLQEAIATAATALKQEPSLRLQYDYLYQQGRAAYLSENTRLARSQWDGAITLTSTEPTTTTLPARPEARYGQARLLLDEARREDARNELNAALAADERFFPARQLLATLAEEDQRWDEAVQHYQWLADNRPWDAATRRSLARVLQAQGNAAAAEAQLLPLANANDVEALVQLAALYRSVSRTDAAQQVLQRALAAGPNDPAVHEEQAASAIARQDYGAAEVSLRRALELDPQRSSAHITLGRLYAGPLNRPTAAAEQFQAAVANESLDPLVHRQLGEVLLQIGNPEAAAASFRRAIELAPNSHEAYHGLAMAYLAQGRYDDAEKEEQRALDLAGGNYTLAIVGMGDIAREETRYTDAVARYTEALNRDPQLPAAYLGLGRTALAQGQADIALTHFDQGLALAPNNVPLLLGRGDALLQQNRVDAAAEAYGRARELEPGNAAAHAGVGRALWRAGRTEEALAALQQATQINPNDAAALLIIGDINETLNRTTPALDAYARAIDIRPEWYEPRYRRGVLLLKLERTEEAIKDLEEAVQRNETFAQGRYWLGRSYRAAARFSDAERQFRRAVELKNDYFEARYFLGRTLDELGRAPDAVAIYTAIINEAPSGDAWRDEATRELDRIR